MATNMITAMYKQGYIKKHISERDRRSSVISPTLQAELLVENTYEEYNKTIRLLENKMGGRDFNAMISLLTQANTILMEEKKHG